MVHDVFICYSADDKDFTERLCAIIEQAGILCWIAPRNVRPGCKYAREIVEAIQNCSVMLLIFSDASNKSEHVENEITIAFDEGKTIIPFKITDTEMSVDLKYYLNKKHWIDGTPEPEKCFKQLVGQISMYVPHLFFEMEKNKLLDNFYLILDEYKKQKSDIPDEKLKRIEKKLKELIDTGKDVEFQKLLDEFIATELSDSTEPSEVRTEESDQKELAGRYDLLQNGAGELMLIINGDDSEPNKSRFVYDGGNSAILYKNKEIALTLGSLSEDTGKIIRAVESILVIEVKNNDVLREYTVPVRNIKNLDRLLKMWKN